MDATEKELLTWKRMLKKPGVPVKDVLPLRERYRNSTVVTTVLSPFIVPYLLFSLDSRLTTTKLPEINPNVPI